MGVIKVFDEKFSIRIGEDILKILMSFRQ